MNKIGVFIYLFNHFSYQAEGIPRPLRRPPAAAAAVVRQRLAAVLRPAAVPGVDADECGRECARVCGHGTRAIYRPSVDVPLGRLPGPVARPAVPCEDDFPTRGETHPRLLDLRPLLRRLYLNPTSLRYNTHFCHFQDVYAYLDGYGGGGGEVVMVVGFFFSVYLHFRLWFFFDSFTVTFKFKMHALQSQKGKM